MNGKQAILGQIAVVKPVSRKCKVKGLDKWRSNRDIISLCRK